MARSTKVILVDRARKKENGGESEYRWGKRDTEREGERGIERGEMRSTEKGRKGERERDRQKKIMK